MAYSGKKLLTVTIIRDAKGNPIPKTPPKPSPHVPINPAQVAVTKGSNGKPNASHPDMNFDGGLDTYGLPPRAPIA